MRRTLMQVGTSYPFFYTGKYSQAKNACFKGFIACVGTIFREIIEHHSGSHTFLSQAIPSLTRESIHRQKTPVSRALSHVSTLFSVK